MQHNQSPPTLSEILSEFDVPQRLESLLAKMLAKDPADRPQSFDYVARELANVVRTMEERRNLAEFRPGCAALAVSEKLMSKLQILLT